MTVVRELSDHIDDPGRSGKTCDPACAPETPSTTGSPRPLRRDGTVAGHLQGHDGIALGRRADGESITSIAKGLTYKTASGEERTVSRRALYNAFKAHGAERAEAA